MNMTLPTNPAERKATPIWRGCVRFFAAALAGVARTSQQFESGCDLNHARKTINHMDYVMRHAMDAEDLIAAYERNIPPCAMDAGEHKRLILEAVDQATWRVLAWSQAMHEKYGGAPLAPGAANYHAPEPPHVYENGRCWCGEEHKLPLTVGGAERGPQSVPVVSSETLIPIVDMTCGKTRGCWLPNGHDGHCD